MLEKLRYPKRCDILYQKPKKNWLQGARDSGCVPQCDDISWVTRQNLRSLTTYDPGTQRKKSAANNPTQATEESKNKSGGSERKHVQPKNSTHAS